MSTRRTFLTTGLAATAASAFTPSPTAYAASAAAANAVHTSFAQIAVKHLRKQVRNPRHNPFATTELATAFRMHCDALQASGQNDTITAAINQGATLPIPTATDLEVHYATLAKLGIHFSAPQKQYITQHLTEAASPDLMDRIATVTKQHAILKVQRVVHAQTMFMQPWTLKNQAVSAAAAPWAKPRVQDAVYRPGAAHLKTAEQCLTCDPWDDGGGDFSGGWDGWGDWGPGDLGGGGGGGSYTPPWYPYDGAVASLLDSTIQLPSGGHIELCQAFWSMMALGVGFWGAISLLGAGGGTLVVAGVVLSGVVLAATIAIIAAYAAYEIAVC